MLEFLGSDWFIWFTMTGSVAVLAYWVFRLASTIMELRSGETKGENP
jgi:hypothetical protein